MLLIPEIWNQFPLVSSMIKYYMRDSSNNTAKKELKFLGYYFFCVGTVDWEAQNKISPPLTIKTPNQDQNIQ